MNEQKQERKITKSGTKILIGKIILATIASAGVLTVAMVAPNSLKAIDLFYPKEKRKYHRGSYVKKSITKLKEKGLIKFEKNNDGTIFVRLTKKGHRKLLKYQLREKAIKKPKKWDGKWRVVIFDVQEQARNLREGLRKELINLGFIKLQNSVWVYPYECEEIIGLVKTYFCIGKNVLYMTVEKIEDDKWLREEFSLV
ncbi:MAG: CRISPR-associated endonuclease Cas2 [Candidatus Marinimicrobia bacterium]|nr:CRISPR-associated endonuclease Cas2 [Candidatus Neomarinimicrobiota bacterium]